MASSTELAIERLRRNQEKLKAKLDQLHKEFNSSDSIGKDVPIVVGRSPYLTRKRARTKMLTPDNVRTTGSRRYPLRPTNGSFLDSREDVPRTPFSPALTRRSIVLTPTPHTNPSSAVTDDTMHALNNDDEISRTMIETSINPPGEVVTPATKKNSRRLSSTPKGKDRNAKFVSFAESEGHLPVKDQTISDDTVSLSTISGSGDHDNDDDHTSSSSEPLVDRSLERAILSNTGESNRKSGSQDRGDLTLNFESGKGSSSHSRGFGSQSKSLLEKELMGSLRSSRHGNLERSMRALRSTKKLLDYSAIDPSLGYDWIAGAIDVEDDGSVLQASDEYFDMIREFRRVNRDECTRPKTLSPPSVVTPKTKRKYLTSDSGCDHDKTTRSTSYMMNDRLFPVPLHEFEDNTHCPVCEGSNRPDEEEEEPTRFIRVSVPRVSLQSPYKWSKKYRRRTCDLVESMGLSQHCEPGWESARPVIVPSQDSVDLSSSLIQGQLGTRRVSEDLLNMSRSTKYRLMNKTKH